MLWTGMWLEWLLRHEMALVTPYSNGLQRRTCIKETDVPWWSATLSREDRQQRHGVIDLPTRQWCADGIRNRRKDIESRRHFLPHLWCDLARPPDEPRLAQPPLPCLRFAAQKQMV